MLSKVKIKSVTNIMVVLPVIIYLYKFRQVSVYDEFICLLFIYIILEVVLFKYLKKQQIFLLNIIFVQVEITFLREILYYSRQSISTILYLIIIIFFLRKVIYNVLVEEKNSEITWNRKEYYHFIPVILFLFVNPLFIITFEIFLNSLIKRKEIIFWINILLVYFITGELILILIDLNSMVF